MRNAADAELLHGSLVARGIRIEVGPDELVVVGFHGVAGIDVVLHGLARAAPDGGEDGDDGLVVLLGLAQRGAEESFSNFGLPFGKSAEKAGVGREERAARRGQCSECFHGIDGFTRFGLASGERLVPRFSAGHFALSNETTANSFTCSPSASSASFFVSVRLAAVKVSFCGAFLVTLGEFDFPDPGQFLHRVHDRGLAALADNAGDDGGVLSGSGVPGAEERAETQQNEENERAHGGQWRGFLTWINGHCSTGPKKPEARHGARHPV